MAKSKRSTSKSAAEQSEPAKGVSNKGGKQPKTNRPKDTVKSRAGKASAAARKAKRESGEPIKRPCSASRTNGEPCGNSAIRGGTVCVAHGGRAPQVRAKANQRLLNMVEPALKELRRILDDPAAGDRDKLRAINMVLNRTGLAEKQELEVGMRPPTVFEQLTTGTFVFDRSGLDFDMDELDGKPHPALGGGDDLSDEALDALLDERERRRARDASTKLDNSGHEVITAEVVDDPSPTPKTKRAETGPRYRGRTSDVGPVSFPDHSDPRTSGSELDPEPGGRYRRPRTQRDLYEAEEDS